MVMLERLFLQSERVSLAEDRRKTRRDPGNKAQDYFVCLSFSLVKQGSSNPTPEDHCPAAFSSNPAQTQEPVIFFNNGRY